MNFKLVSCAGAIALSSLMLRSAILAHADQLPATAELRIALLSDPHTTRSQKEDRPLFKKHFEDVIAAVNAAHPDLVLIAGDLTDGGLAEQYGDFKERIQGFQPPVLYVPGNHDVGDKILEGKTGGIKETRLKQYETTLGDSYFVSNQPKVRVIGVNSSLLGSGLPEEDQEWAFLEQELAKPAAVPTVVVMHYPPFTKTSDEPGGGYWNLEPAPRQRFLDLIQRSHVSVVLTGHLHRPLLNHYEGTPIITTTAVSWGIPAGKQAEGWTLVTVDTHGAVHSETQTVAH